MAQQPVQRGGMSSHDGAQPLWGSQTFGVKCACLCATRCRRSPSTLTSTAVYGTFWRNVKRQWNCLKKALRSSGLHLLTFLFFFKPSALLKLKSEPFFFMHTLDFLKPECLLIVYIDNFGHTFFEFHILYSHGSVQLKALEVHKNTNAIYLGKM